MRLKTIQAILLTVFVLSGMVLLLNQPVESTDVALPHTTANEPQEYPIPEGPVVHITLPGIPQERPNIEGILMVVIMVCTMVGLLGSIFVSKTQRGAVQ